jgi:ubiquinone/menaquinone biosynthesis C-methylase UbiE
MSADAWDAIFDELYLKTYAKLQADESGDEEIEALLATLGLEPPADVLDSAAGYGRHALALARRGFRVTAHDRSAVLLAEAERRAAEVEVTFVEGDYRELPFQDASFDLVLNLFSAIGYWGDDGDLQAFREFRRVLRPGGRAVIETMHRDRLVRVFRPTDWHELEGDDLLLEARELDQVEGVVNVTFSYRPHAAEPKTVHYSIRAYTATELAKLLREAGFERVEALGGYDGSPFTLDSRLVAVATAP